MKLVDLTYLNSVSEDAEIIDSLITIFLDQLPEFAMQMDASLAKQDFKSLAEVSHKAKASITSMGMAELAAEMKHMEMLAKQLYTESTNACPEIADDYKRQLSAMPEDIKQWVNSNKNINAIENIIKFYKLQADLANAELNEYLESK